MLLLVDAVVIVCDASHRHTAESVLTLTIPKISQKLELPQSTCFDGYFIAAF